MKKIFRIVVLLIVVVGCKDVFNPPPKAFLNATLNYTDQELSDKEIVVSVVGVDMDEPWIDQDTTKSILLPLNDTPNTDFVFTLNEMVDTVRITADSKLIYESMETGFYPEFKILEISHTHYRIDNIEVLDSAVTKNWNENIIININTRISARN